MESVTESHELLHGGRAAVDPTNALGASIVPLSPHPSSVPSIGGRWIGKDPGGDAEKVDTVMMLALPPSSIMSAMRNHVISDRDNQVL